MADLEPGVHLAPDTIAAMERLSTSQKEIPQQQRLKAWKTIEREAQMGFPLAIALEALRDDQGSLVLEIRELRDQVKALEESFVKPMVEVGKIFPNAKVAMDAVTRLHDDLEPKTSEPVPGDVPFLVVPPNCRQRLQIEGKPYSKSNCEVCGSMSPMWLQCNAALETQQSGITNTPSVSLRCPGAHTIAECGGPCESGGSHDRCLETHEYRPSMPTTPSPAGSLVERVGADAIREVAAWLRAESEGHFGSGLHWAQRLDQEATR
jgi:hypothetical protein